MTQTVTAIYDTYDDAVAATRALAEAGIPVSDVSIISNKGARTWPDIGAAVGSLGQGLEAALGGVGETVGGLGKGLGATVGGVGETVGGLGKGLGEAVGGIGKGLGEAVGGIGKGLGETVGGLGKGVGETVGGVGKGVEALLTGLVGTLTGAGMPEREANRYAEGVRRGGIMVTAHVADDQAPSARKMLRH
jgi:hypothetical protein